MCRKHPYGLEHPRSKFWFFHSARKNWRLQPICFLSISRFDPLEIYSWTQFSYSMVIILICPLQNVWLRQSSIARCFQRMLSEEFSCFNEQIYLGFKERNPFGQVSVCFTSLRVSGSYPKLWCAGCFCISNFKHRPLYLACLHIFYDVS